MAEKTNTERNAKDVAAEQASKFPLNRWGESANQDEWNDTLNKAEYDARNVVDWIDYLLHTSLPDDQQRDKLEELKNTAQGLADDIYYGLRTDRE